VAPHHPPGERPCRREEKGTYLSERYRQLARRRGKKKALVALGHDILVTAYQLLATDQLFKDSLRALLCPRCLPRYGFYCCQVSRICSPVFASRKRHSTQVLPVSDVDAA
jgi:hypothetical protein